VEMDVESVVTGEMVQVGMTGEWSLVMTDLSTDTGDKNPYAEPIYTKTFLNQNSFKIC